MWSFGDGVSHHWYGLQAAAQNIFLEGFIPAAESVKGVLSDQLDSGIVAGQLGSTELISRDPSRSRLSGDQCHFMTPGF